MTELYLPSRQATIGFCSGCCDRRQSRQREAFFTFLSIFSFFFLFFTNSQRFGIVPPSAPIFYSSVESLKSEASNQMRKLRKLFMYFQQTINWKRMQRKYKTSKEKPVHASRQRAWIEVQVWSKYTTPFYAVAGYGFRNYSTHARWRQKIPPTPRHS